ncbi:MAG: BamA/TamA family outer membrane protein, partial [Candidatus Methylomirabilota bacterium]
EPRRGGSHLISLEVGAPVFGSEVHFTKFQLETRWYLDWLSPTVLALSGRLGLAAPFGGTPALDIDDRFKAGGITTVRGYPEDRVGPADAAGNPVGGNARALLNAEWRFPIWRWLGGALFVDAGTVTPEAGDLVRAKVKTGVGGGLRIATPIGPIRMDVGYALNTLPTREDRWQLTFGIGHPF